MSLWNRSREKYVLSVLKSLGKLNAKMNGFLGKMQERKLDWKLKQGAHLVLFMA